MSDEDGVLVEGRDVDLYFALILRRVLDALYTSSRINIHPLAEQYISDVLTLLCNLIAL